jgi:hypothetical protein
MVASRSGIGDQMFDPGLSRRMVVVRTRLLEVALLAFFIKLFIESPK